MSQRVAAMNDMLFPFLLLAVLIASTVLLTMKLSGPRAPDVARELAAERELTQALNREIASKDKLIAAYEKALTVAKDRLAAGQWTPDQVMAAHGGVVMLPAENAPPKTKPKP